MTVQLIFLSLNKLQKVYEEKHQGFLFGKILIVETNKLSIKRKKKNNPEFGHLFG